MSSVEFPQLLNATEPLNMGSADPIVLPEKTKVTNITEWNSASSLSQANHSSKSMSILQNTYLFSQEEAEQITAFAGAIEKLDPAIQTGINPGFVTKLKSLCAKILNFFGNKSMVYQLQQEGITAFKELKDHLLNPDNKDFLSFYINDNSNNSDALKGLALVLGSDTDLKHFLSPTSVAASTTGAAGMLEQLDAELDRITQQADKGEVPTWSQFWKQFAEAFPLDKFSNREIDPGLFNNYMAKIGELHKKLGTPPVNNEIPGALASQLTADGLESVPTQGVGNCAFDAALLSLFSGNGLYIQGKNSQSYNLAFNLYLESVVGKFREKVAEEASKMGFSPADVSDIGKLNQFAEDNVFGPIAKTLQKTIVFYDHTGGKQCYLPNGDLSFEPEDMSVSDALTICYNGHNHYVALKKQDS